MQKDLRGSPTVRDTPSPMDSTVEAISASTSGILEASTSFIDNLANVFPASKPSTSASFMDNILETLSTSPLETAVKSRKIPSLTSLDLPERLKSSEDLQTGMQKAGEES